MYRRHKFVFLVILCAYVGSVFAKNAIVQKDGGERLGDRLLIICAVKFFSLIHDLDFYYHSSQSVEQCALSLTEKKFNDQVKACYQKTMPFSETALKQARLPTLFIAPWSCIDNFCQYFGKRHLYRTAFDQLRAMVKPLESLPALVTTGEAISVAVHIRKGEGYDNPPCSVQIYKRHRLRTGGVPVDRGWPSKVPPEQYYIDQILALEDLLYDKKINFYIFSDCFDLQALTERIKRHCARANATFIGASSYQGIPPIVDMCKMAACDCLIRPESSYSIVAQIMGNHKLVFSPQRWVWKGGILYITHVKVTLFDNVQNWATECTLEQCDKNLLKQWIKGLFRG